MTLWQQVTQTTQFFLIGDYRKALLAVRLVDVFLDCYLLHKKKNLTVTFRGHDVN